MKMLGRDQDMTRSTFRLSYESRSLCVVVQYISYGDLVIRAHVNLTIDKLYENSWISGSCLLKFSLHQTTARTTQSSNDGLFPRW
jgi:hypothetical protein